MVQQPYRGSMNECIVNFWNCIVLLFFRCEKPLVNMVMIMCSAMAGRLTVEIMQPHDSNTLLKPPVITAQTHHVYFKATCLYSSVLQGTTCKYAHGQSEKIIGSKSFRGNGKTTREHAKNKSENTAMESLP